jgi:hypothetical protein
MTAFFYVGSVRSSIGDDGDQRDLSQAHDFEYSIKRFGKPWSSVFGIDGIIKPE